MTMSDNPYDGKWERQQIETMDLRLEFVDWIKTLGLDPGDQTCLLLKFDKEFDMSHTLGYYMGRKFSHDIKSLSDNSE